MDDQASQERIELVATVLASLPRPVPPRCGAPNVVPVPNQREVVLNYCAESGFDTDALDFDLRGSEVALPEIPQRLVFDLVFIDGNHGFPLPIIDWFYGAGLLREGGIVVFDDLELPQVSHLLEWFLDKDPLGTDRLDHQMGRLKRHSESRLTEPVGQ